MTAYCRIILSITLLILLTNCGSSDLNHAEGDIEAIKAMSDARAKAFNEGNSVEIARHFTQNASLMAPGKPTQHGPSAVQAYYQSIFDEYETELESGYEEVKVEGDLAFGRGFAKVTLYPKNGEGPIKSTSKYLNILERQSDGSWKTTHDIWNSNEE